MKIVSIFINLFLISISVISCFLFVVGFFDILINNENGRQCQMTYMFEYPDFTRIYLKENVKFPQYGLYAYSEGIYTYKIEGLNFKGIPVLFIPGNRGSYKQVRSMASIALRKAVNYKYHFNFFTVDLNEELSGLYGGVLETQAEFVNHSIYRILQLYATRPPKQKPKHVILVAHSMGGIVALKVMANMKDAQNVDLIITLSTPYLRPPINFDPNIDNFYKNVKNAWEPRADYLLNKTVISIGSGFNDRLVNTHLTQFQYTSLHAITTGIPKVWLDVEHVVILWCKQLIMTVVKSLFDLIDLNSLQLIEDIETRKKIFHHHLIQNSGINFKYKEAYANVIPSTKLGDWIELNGEQVSFDSTNISVKHIRWIMIPVSRDYLNKNIIIQARNLDERNWIYYCSAISVTSSKHICEKMYHLTQYSEIVPSLVEKRREINVHFKEIYNKFPEVSHLIIKIPSDSKNVKIDIDVFDPISRNLDVTVPGWYTFYNKLIFKSASQGGIKYKINLHDFDHIYNAASLLVKSECNTSNYQIIGTFNVPWFKHSTPAFFNIQNKKPIPISVFSPKPPEFKYEYSYLELNLDSSCISEVWLKSNIIKSLSQIVQHYSVMLIANMSAILILILRYQLLEDNYTLIVNSAIIQATKPYYFLIIVQLITELLNSNIFTQFIQPDVTILTNENMNFILLPILLHFGGIGCVYLLSFGLWFGIVLGGSTVQKLTLKVLCKRMFGFVRLSEWMLDCMQNFTFGILCALILLASSTAGCLALVLATFYYFLKLVKMYEEYLESLIKTSVITILKQLTKKLFSKKQTTNNKNKNDRNNDSTEINAIDNKTVDNLENDENKNIATVSRIEDLKMNTEPINGNVMGETITNDKVINKTNDDEIENDKEENLKLKDDLKKDDENNKINVENDTEKVESTVISKRNNSIEVNEKQIENENNQEENKESDRKEQQESKKNENLFSPLLGLYFHLIVFMIFSQISVINIPCVLTWARNYKYSKSLVRDPSFIPSIILCISSFYLWNIDIPKTNLKYKNLFGNILYMMAVLTVVYSTLTVYRLSYFLSITILLVALYQRFAPIDEQIDDISSNFKDDNQLMEKIKVEENEQNMMKSKLE